MTCDTEQEDAEKANVPIIVSIKERYLDQFDTVVQRCKRAGLQIEQQLRTIGVLNGSIAPTKISMLEHIEGVDTVEQVRSYQLPPSENDVQ